MKRTRLLVWLVFAAAAVSVRAGELPQIVADGMLALDPPDSGSCLAVRVELSSTQALTGVSWQGSGVLPFARVLVATGAGEVPPVYEDAIPVAIDVSYEASGWTTLEFSQPIASLSGSLYVIFEYPVGVPDIGSAPGLGYVATEEAHLVFLSADGQDWIRMAADYRLLVEPTLEARTPGMVALFAQPQEPLQPLTPQLRVFPNPFNPRTTIALQHVQGQNVELAIYNLQGRRVRTLFHGEAASQEVAVDWDGCDDGGRRQASGVYLVRAHSGELDLRTRVILVK